MQERRIDTRLLCSELVEVLWTDEKGRPQRRIGNLEDISLTGLSLQVEHPIPEGQAVTMRHGTCELLGTVRYCSYRQIGYFLGIQFQEGYRWSTEQFVPEHLVDLQALAKEPSENSKKAPESHVLHLSTRIH